MYRLRDLIRPALAVSPIVRSQLTRNYAKEIKFGVEASSQMIKGVNILADAVAVTMGPKVS